jgi:UDPglucose 6-dehydrogenase
VENADAVVIVTEWEQFRALDFNRLRDLMACPVMIDLRNIYRPEDMKQHGFAYTSVGRRATHQPVGVYTPPESAGSPLLQTASWITCSPE